MDQVCDRCQRIRHHSDEPWYGVGIHKEFDRVCPECHRELVKEKEPKPA